MNVDVALFTLRVVVGGVVAMHGLLKFGLVGEGGSVKGVGGWFEGLGMKPGIFWAWVAALAEAGGGIATVLGVGGPLGPGLIAADLLVVTIVAHVPQGFWAGGGKVGWEFPLPLSAAGFAIALIGNGRWSVDGLLDIRYPDWLLPAWLALMAAGVVAVLASRARFAPEKAQTAG